MQTWIAIVCKDISGLDKPKQRTAFTADTKDRCVRTAIKAKEEWEARGNGPYKIYIGELSNEVVFPVSYKLVEI